MSLQTLLNNFSPAASALRDAASANAASKVGDTKTGGRESTRKAIPTEYKGIRFDSKSEAVFARMLDLSGIQWEHSHPILHDGHSWDFLIWIRVRKWATFCEGGYRNGDPIKGDMKSFDCPGGYNYKPMLVELKPSKPTETYMKNIARRSDEVLCREYRIVVWGNPFSGELQDIGSGWGSLYLAQELARVDQLYTNSTTESLPLSCLLNGFNERCVSDAKNFRFDLARS